MDEGGGYAGFAWLGGVWLGAEAGGGCWAGNHGRTSVSTVKSRRILVSTYPGQPGYPGFALGLPPCRGAVGGKVLIWQTIGDEAEGTQSAINVSTIFRTPDEAIA